MQDEPADVIVVGCGPIGAYLCWLLAGRGLDVLGLERAEEGRPASDIGAFHFEREAFDRTGVPLPAPDAVICTFPGLTVHAPDGRHAVTVEGVETWALDLARFIQDLRDRAVRAGARIRHGVSVTGPLIEGGRVTGVRAGARGTEQRYRAPVTVDASGLRRAVCGRLPAFKSPLTTPPFSVYMEYWHRAESQPADGIHSYAGLNAWTARYPDYWIVGMGQPLGRNKLREAYDGWVRHAFPGSREVLGAVEGVIPYAFPPPTLVDEGVLVVGDAAATNKPYNGEGISSGMELARIAADVLPGAVQNGGSRPSLWEINRRYFRGQGARFAFLRAMGLAMLKRSDDEISAVFRAGLVRGDALRQTFLDQRVHLPAASWIAPSVRMAARPGLLAGFALDGVRAARAARCFARYPAPEGYPRWREATLACLASCCA